jgi:hypothetical protein
MIVAAIHSKYIQVIDAALNKDQSRDLITLLKMRGLAKKLCTQT